MDGGQGSSIAPTIHSLGLTLRMSHFTFRSVPRVDAGETHLNFLPDKKANQAEFVIILLGVVGWVERNSLMIANLSGVFECPLRVNLPKLE